MNRNEIFLQKNAKLIKYHFSEIFWPILASDPKMLDRLILAGCDVNATLVMNNLVLKGLS